MKSRGIVKRRVIVDGMQYKLMGIGALHFVLIVLVFVTALFAPLMVQIGSGDAYNDEVRIAAHQFLTLHHRVWPPLFFTLALLALHNIIVSHRIAGPLFRFRREFGLIGDGDLSRHIKIRRRDYLPNEADAINAMVRSLEKKLSSIDRGFRRADAALVRVEDAAERSSREEFDDALAEARAGLNEAGRTLDNFKTKRASQTPAPSGSKPEPKPVADPVA